MVISIFETVLVEINKFGKEDIYNITRRFSSLITDRLASEISKTNSYMSRLYATEM